eukprot:g7878.t1
MGEKLDAVTAARAGEFAALSDGEDAELAEVDEELDVEGERSSAPAAKFGDVVASLFAAVTRFTARASRGARLLARPDRRGTAGLRCGVTSRDFGGA